MLGGALMLGFVASSGDGALSWVRGTTAFRALTDQVVVPLMRLVFDAEDAHIWTIRSLQMGLGPRESPYIEEDDKAHALLKTRVFGLDFRNPIGLAAGFDKQAQVMGELLEMGFGFLEVGGITPEPQPGNPRPRCFRLLEDRAVVNRYGLNSQGHASVVPRLAEYQQRKAEFVESAIRTVRQVQDNREQESEQSRGAEAASFPSDAKAGESVSLLASMRKFASTMLWSRQPMAQVSLGALEETLKDEANAALRVPTLLLPTRYAGPVGVNLAKNTASDDAEGDYGKGVRALGDHVQFLVVNVSCPNVGWTKNLRGSDISKLVDAVRSERDALLKSSSSGSKRKLPVLLKIGPDSSDSELEALVRLAHQTKVDGLVVTNTSSQRPDTLESPLKGENGGLSGEPLKQKSLETLRKVYQLSGGNLGLIGVGGVSTGQDAYERIRAGASLVQIYTAMVYQGPGIVHSIKEELQSLLERDGFCNVAQAVGAEHRTPAKN